MISRQIFAHFSSNSCNFLLEFGSFSVLWTHFNDFEINFWISMKHLSSIVSVSSQFNLSLVEFCLMFISVSSNFHFNNSKIKTSVFASFFQLLGLLHLGLHGLIFVHLVVCDLRPGIICFQGFMTNKGLCPDFTFTIFISGRPNKA